MDKLVVTIKEASLIVPYGESTIRKAINTGKLESVFKHGKYVIDVEKLKEWALTADDE